MKTLAATLTAACLALAAVSAPAADDAMKKADMTKDGMAKPMTMQDCKEHMAMAKKDGMAKDDAMMKKDAMCSDMMKKEGMMKKEEAMMKPGMAPVEPMKK